ncbi:MAG: MBL fold metallo-hydrolase, partial [Anaerolineales bacterium]
MQLTFNGAAQTVTGSQHLLTVNGHNLLLDCGMFQGRRKETYTRNLNFNFNPEDIDAVILSHAHIDHSGNLPNLVKQGFSGPIHATLPTVHLVDIMLRDSGHIQEQDVEYVNRRRARKGEPPVQPLYTIADAVAATDQLSAKRYGEVFEPVPGVQAHLVEAGHILGSAAVVLDIEENGSKKRIWFSGDIGRSELPIVRDPVLPSKADYLIMESTYGDSFHETVGRAYSDLHEIAHRTLERGGKLIIPAFAVGRTQMLVFYLHQMIDHGDLPRIPVFVDSPLAISVSEIFKEHPEVFDKEAQAFMKADQHSSIFGFDLLKFTRSVEESKAINDVEGPAVIISASGMAEVGRILHHLRNHGGDPNNTILITSWMAPHTLGRRLVEGKKKVKIFGEEHTIRAEVEVINGLSAHASQPSLLSYALATEETVKQIFLVHGEKDAATALM